MMRVMARPTTRPSREEKKAMTRTKLLDAAATVFARKGFAGASLDDVAEEAGLTKGAVYSNFASKDDLIEALLDERLDEPQQNIANLVDPDAPPDVQGQQAAALFMSLLDRQRDDYLLAIEFMAHLARNPQRARSGTHRKRVTAMAQFMQERADEQGRTLPLPAYDLAVALFALGQGIALDRMVNPDDVPDDLFGRILNVIMGNVGIAQGSVGNAKR
jgi:AcrR family transcriptional regulator